MYSVTKRIKEIKQPRGGYIHPNTFKLIEYDDNIKLSENENIHAILVGLAVDYLTRYLLGYEKEEVFHISMKGASLLSVYENNFKYFKKAQDLLDNIQGLDNKSIISACKIVGFDVCTRGNLLGYQPIEIIEPNEETINNIKIMVNRGLNFFKIYGPITKSGFTFQGGYTEIVSSGDGDFLTKYTLWDFKVSKNKPTKDHTLQLLMYYLMGLNSIHDDFEEIINLGIFNPRLNIVYILNISEISKEIIDIVSKEVIGYGM